MNRLLERSLTAIVLVATGTCFLAGLPAEAAATSGVMRLTSSTTLTENHTGVIVIEGNNIVLDCNYKYLLESTSSSTHICGEGRNESCGILIIGRSRPTVRKCRPRYFEMGMYLESVSLGTFHNNRFESNIKGVRIENSSSGTFDTNYYRYNDEEGLDLEETSFGNSFYRSLFNANGRDGADLGGANQNRFEDSDFVNNGRNGLECDGCFLTWVAYNTFDGNGFASTSEPRSGLSFDASDLSAVWDNFAFDNARDGIRVTNDSDDGEFMGNTAYDNGSGCDATEDGTSRNEWHDNDFEAACPSSLE